MKFLALVFAATVATVSAIDCNINALAPVATGADANQCSLDADGYKAVMAKPPTATQLPKMCASKACLNLLAALKKAAPSECTVAIVNPPVALYAALLTPIDTYCNALTSSPPATTTPTFTPAPTTTTKAPPAACY